jgi:S-methylmethionine-dependent homocysteine/selenocysteine methylase
MMDIRKLLVKKDFILAEAAVVESLRRSDKVELHPRLVHALLIYDKVGAGELSDRYNRYIAVAQKAGVPIVICTPTWRSNKERLSEVNLSSDVNKDAVDFMKRIRDDWSPWEENILIGGVIGCRNDCYKPEEGLSAEEADDFHSWQTNKLAEAGVDFLIAETLPSVPEGKGIAQAMSRSGIPYFICFVIDRKGKILDGNSLEYAFDEIDSGCDIPPTGFMISCSYPSFLNADRQPASIFSRLVGYLANASSLDQSELDEAGALEVDAITDWGNQMIELNRKHSVRILGGCCGTNAQHLQYIVDNISI